MMPMAWFTTFSVVAAPADFSEMPPCRCRYPIEEGCFHFLSGRKAITFEPRRYVNAEEGSCAYILFGR